jgi:hypothetical protein
MTSHGYKQNEISRELSMGTKIFKTCYYTVLRVFSFKENKNVDDSATLKAASLIPLNILRTIFISFTSDDSGRSVL